MMKSYLILGLFICFKCFLFSENLIENDRFYEDTLPHLLGSNFKAKGTYRTPYYTRCSHFLPLSNDPFVNNLWYLCTGSLVQFKFGYYQSMAPNLALKMERREVEGGVDYYVELRSNLYWNPVKIKDKKLSSIFQNKVPVTSRDFKFYVDLFKNPYLDLPAAHALKKQFEGLESIEVIDDFHFIVHCKGEITYFLDERIGGLKPLPFHVFMRNEDGTFFGNQEEKKQSEVLIARHFKNHWAKSTIVSCGPWVFDEDNLDCISLVKNPDFPDPYAALFEQMQFIYKTSPTTAWQAFKLNEMDSFYLQPSQERDYEQFLNSKLYKKQQEIQKLEFSSRLFYFIGWNQKNPLFQNANIRRALTHALNRSKIIEHFLKGHGDLISGPFLPSSPSYNSAIKPLEYDPLKAQKLLEQEGWLQKQIHSIRVKDNKPFQFHLIYFLGNELAQSICQSISCAFKEIGVDCILEGVDSNQFMERYEHKNFDAIFMAWALGTPPEDLSATWGSESADIDGSSNLVGFKHAEVDACLHQLKFERDLSKRKQAYYTLHEIISKEQPYTFLYVPRLMLLSRQSLQNVFIPKERSDLVTEADIAEPCPRIFFFKED